MGFLAQRAGGWEPAVLIRERIGLVFPKTLIDGGILTQTKFSSGLSIAFKES